MVCGFTMVADPVKFAGGSRNSRFPAGRKLIWVTRRFFFSAAALRRA
eukprot:COSAG04_NODE_28187_length_277_cov_0.724719_1_plen_46_part_10